MAFRLHVWGKYACFRRPEFSQDFVTYDVMPPAAARSFFEAVHGPPSIQWTLQYIRVLSPINPKWFFLRDGEHRETLVPLEARADPGASSAMRRALVLVDAAYVISARFDLTGMARAGETAMQHAETFRRRARQKRFFRQPFLGLRELEAQVILLEKDMPDPPSRLEEHQKNLDLGWMTYGTHVGERPDVRFFRPKLIDGVVEVPGPDSETLTR